MVSSFSVKGHGIRRQFVAALIVPQSILMAEFLVQPEMFWIWHFC